MKKLKIQKGGKDGVVMFLLMVLIAAFCIAWGIRSYAHDDIMGAVLLILIGIANILFARKINKKVITWA